MRLLLSFALLAQVLLPPSGVEPMPTPAPAPLLTAAQAAYFETRVAYWRTAMKIEAPVRVIKDPDLPVQAASRTTVDPDLSGGFRVHYADHFLVGWPCEVVPEQVMDETAAHEICHIMLHANYITSPEAGNAMTRVERVAVEAYANLCAQQAVGHLLSCEPY